MIELKRELDVATELARLGGELLTAEVARPEGPRGSGSKAPVDDEICALVVAGLREAFPDDAVISEELPALEGTSGRAWHVDPHDGTRHFLRGSRDTSVSIGLVQEGRLLLGVVHAPLPSRLTGRGLRVEWAQGLPLLHDGQPVTCVQPPHALREGSRILVSPGLRDAVLDWNRELAAPAELIGCGSPATRMALVAAGEASAGVVLRVSLSSWDFAAGQALLEAAGGALVDSDGFPIVWEGTEPREPDTRNFFAGCSIELAQDVARRYQEGLSQTPPTVRSKKLPEPEL